MIDKHVFNGIFPLALTLTNARPRSRRSRESRKDEQCPPDFHSHGSVRTSPWFGPPCARTWKRREFAAGSGGTNSAVARCFAPTARFVLFLGNVGRPEAHDHKERRHQCNRVLLSKPSTDPIAGSKCSGHDRRIPSPPAGLYHDNKLSRSRVYWIFFEIMVHLVEFDNDNAVFRWCGLGGMLFGKVINPIEHGRPANATELAGRSK